ncbi:MAG TPA: VOC family protein [Caulobacteraceae bacterium]|nr:VOC family protein [Caulobacteraceae bacterium]
MPEMPPPTPIGLTPYLTIRGGRGHEAVAFYKRAFGAEEMFSNIAEDGERYLHGRLRINGAVVFFSDDFPEFRGGAPATAPGGVTFHLQVDDADAWAKRAIEAGAEVTQPISDAFWGDRYGQLRDPFGHAWSLGSAIKG